MNRQNLFLLIALLSGIFLLASCEKGGELIPSTTGGGHPTGLDEIERLEYQHLTEHHLYTLVSVESDENVGGIISFELDTEFDNDGAGNVWLTQAGLLRTGAWATTNTIVGDNNNVPGYGLTLINQADGSSYSYKTEEKFYEPEFALSQAAVQVEPIIVFNSDEYLTGTDLCDLELFVPHLGEKSNVFEDVGHIAPTHKWSWGSKFTRTVPVTNSITYEMPDGQTKVLENDVMARKSCVAIQFPNGKWFLDFIAFREVSGTDKFERIMVQLDSVVHNGTNYELFYNPNSSQSLQIHAWTTINGTAPISGVPPYDVTQTVFQYVSLWPDLTYCSEIWVVVNYPGQPAVPSIIVWDDEGPNW